MAPTRRLSASKLERAFECPASTVLPQIETEVGGAAERGTAIHKYLEVVSNELKSGRSIEEASNTGLQAVPEAYREDCEAIDLRALPLGGLVRTEVGFAYNYRTGAVRILGEGLAHGDVSGGPNEITGIADLVEDDGSSVLIGDYKTGRGYIPPAVRNRQLLFLALCASKHFGRSRAVGVLAKLREDGSSYFDSAEYDAMDLAAYEGELKEAIRQAEIEAHNYEFGKDMRYRKGKHCEYCPSFQYCEAQTAIIRQMATAPASLGSVVSDALAKGDAVSAYEKFREMELVMKEVRKALYSWAGQNPIELPDGKVFGTISYPRDVMVPEVAYKVISEVAGEDVAGRAASFKVTKKGIKDAARAVNEKRKAAGMKSTIQGCNDDLLAAVSAAGGIVQEIRRKTCEHRPGEAVEDDE